VTPSLTGYSFTPASRNHSNVTSSQTGQDFTATAGGGSAMFFIHADHLNTPRAITNQTAQVVWRWDQSDPFGGNVANENPSGLGTFTYNLRFPGQYFDKETTLHYNYFRDYDPAIGRYVQSDPIGIYGGINTYSYVGGNPISRSDSTGLLVDTRPDDGGSGGPGSGDCRLIRQTGPLMIGRLIGQEFGWMLCTYDCGTSCPPKKGDIITRFVRVFNPPFKCVERVSRRIGE
jgi:RHS repeat-associated protein